jgi:monofunctional biosynthetic peptidoglycan transglycosylase
MAGRSARRSSPSRRPRSTKRRGLIGWIVRILFALILFSVLWVLAYRFINPPLTATMVSDLIAGRGADRQWMGIDRLDRDMVRAAIAAEDAKFCAHNGFDFKAIEDAAKRNASGGRIRGGSTISQQAAKNAFLWQGGGYARKGAEAWFTFLIEHLWGKRRIMEVYLNLAETGIGTYGVNAGSIRYFGHDASAMSATEAARIAAVLPLPKKRGAVAPVGFTRRYGSIIAARIGTVGRDGLDACVYAGTTAPANRAPPVERKATRPLPGSEYESKAPPPPAPDVDQSAPEPALPQPPAAMTPEPAPSSAEPSPPSETNSVEAAPSNLG